MNLLSTVHDRLVGARIGLGMGGDALERSVEAVEESMVKAKEGLADLELMFEDIGWRDLTTNKWDFSPAGLRKVMGLSRLMYLVNPLIHRAVTVQELYVFGLGFDIKAETDIVDEVLDDFFKDPKNQKTIGDAWPEREREQRIDGNTYLAFFVNPANGSARVRVIPPEQIENIIFNPDDAQEPWYYKRYPGPVTNDAPFGAPSAPVGTVPIYLPCIHYRPKRKVRNIDGIKVDWDTQILHIKTGGLSIMKFGMPELFSALNWATAYKRILENFATILAAYARLAMKVTGLAGARGVAASKARLATGISSPSVSIDRNPPTNVASWANTSGNVDIQPVKTANSTTGPDEARALRSMVAAGSDTPEHFFGDSDVGNFATSETLDRPTELKMIARQNMWKAVMVAISRLLIQWSAQAPGGKLNAAGYVAREEADPFDGTRLVTVVAPADKSTKVTITFPTITERDVTERVRAVVNAITLNGRHAEGIVPSRKFAFKLLMIALGERDADALADKYYPDEVTQGFVDPSDEAENARMEAEALKIRADAAKVTAEKPVPKVTPSPASSAA